MKTTFLKRAVAGLILGGGLLIAAPSIAAADTLVYQGYSQGAYQYFNVQGNYSFASATFIGHVYETRQCSEQSIQ